MPVADCSRTRRGARCRTAARALTPRAAVGVSPRSRGRRGGSSTISSTPTDHWLIPDNIQENRRELVAHRTSPTNIGLQLLSTLAAYDFGYISVAALLTRLEATFATLLNMQRYRGHFYNWYDTRTLEPLAPRYISTVDSGNLAGYLVTLRAALLDIGEHAPVDRRIVSGGARGSRSAWSRRSSRAA